MENPQVIEGPEKLVGVVADGPREPRPPEISMEPLDHDKPPGFSESTILAALGVIVLHVHAHHKVPADRR
jgi:hypothetical protein